MSGYKGIIHLLYGYLCSARWLVFGYFPDELRRIPLPRTSVNRLLLREASGFVVWHASGC